MSNEATSESSSEASNHERDENAMSARAKSRIGRGEAAWPGEAGIESRIRPSGASGGDETR